MKQLTDEEIEALPVNEKNALLKKMQTIILGQKKFGLVWEEEIEPEKVVEECKTKLPILSPVPSRTLKNGLTNNVLIEGDNFHSLSSLNLVMKDESGSGMIDVIYIDPPYNTGNKDFAYNDEFVDKDDKYPHSKWLNMISKRLFLAYGLLKDNGVMFISIDDNEQANLKLLCDSIFGKNGFITTIHVEMSTTQGMKVKAAQNGNLVKNCEYILVYSKDGHKNIAKHLLYDLRNYDGHYNKFLNGDHVVDLKGKVQPIIESSFQKDSLEKLYLESEKFREFVKNHLEQIVADDKISGFEMSDYEPMKVYKVEKKGRSYLIYNNGTKMRQFLKLSDSFGPCDDFNNSTGLRKIRGDLWKDFYLDMGNVSKEGDVVFENGKKPVRLIKQLLKMSTDKDSIVLDFFAGSGTTGQAVAELNEEDGGKRRFILCTNNEVSFEKETDYLVGKGLIENEPNKQNDILHSEWLKKRQSINQKYKNDPDYQQLGVCQSVCYPRIKNVFCGTNGKGEKIADPIKENVFYYKADFVDLTSGGKEKNADDIKTDLASKCSILLSIKEDCPIKLSHEEGFETFSDCADKKRIYVFFGLDAPELIEKNRKNFENYKGEKVIFEFSFDGLADEELISGITSCKIKPIPTKMLQRYKDAMKRMEANKVC